ncbi:DoxX family protein [Variovorax sp. RHLX14]|uniref:DoxX family protein n=1 Tax=Variovorax sp. RHLX14 TaxID=1259731 RepID=UPI003F46B6B5
MTPLRRAGLAFVFLWFFIGGIAHFVATATEMRIVPPYIPWPREVVLASGVLELLGAAGLLWRPTRRAAGIGLFLLTIAVTPANVHMLQEPGLFPSVPYWALVLRLPLQIALLALIAWTTWRSERRS